MRSNGSNKCAQRLVLEVVGVIQLERLLARNILILPTAFVGPLFSEHMAKTLRLLSKDRRCEWRLDLVDGFGPCLLRLVEVQRA